MKIRLLGSILVLTISNSLFAQSSISNFEKKILYGCWIVKDHLHDEEASYSKERLSQYSKKAICFSNTEGRLFVDVIHSPNYSLSKVSTTNYLWDTYNLNKKYFQIVSDTLIAISIKGTLTSKNRTRSIPTEYSLFYDGRYLFLYVDGATFRFQKVNFKR